MSKFRLTLAAAATALVLGVPLMAHAQGSSKPTPEEKAQARAERRVEGAQAARNPLPEVAPNNLGTRGAVTREERQEAREERREQGAEAARNPSPDISPNSMGAKGASTKAERKAARAQRKAKVTKERNLPSGEK